MTDFQFLARGIALAGCGISLLQIHAVDFGRLSTGHRNRDRRLCLLAHHGGGRKAGHSDRAARIQRAAGAGSAEAAGKGGPHLDQL